MRPTIGPARRQLIERIQSSPEALLEAFRAGMIRAVRDRSESIRTARRRPGGESRLTENLIGHYGYVGIALILVLGGLGLPIPEEAPIILAAVLTRQGRMSAAPALASCLGGVLLGDFVVYLLGFFYGEKVLSLRLTRRLLTRAREAQIKGYFHRHGFKILVSGRFVPGFRTAAYLTAGILKLPTLKLLVTDLIAASLSTAMMFGLGFAFASQIEKGIREVQQWVALVLAAGISGWLIYRYDKARRRAGMLVGPPVLETDLAPLPAGADESGSSTRGDLAASSIGLGGTEIDSQHGAAVGRPSLIVEGGAAVLADGSDREARSSAGSGQDGAGTLPPDCAAESLVLGVNAAPSPSAVDSPSP
jgi:membrane protein DedA with SNARE-associated domain